MIFPSIKTPAYCEFCCHELQDREVKCPFCQTWRYEGDEAQQVKKKMRSFSLELPLKRDLEALFAASEYRAFLLYFAPIYLEAFLPPIDYLHLLLISALHILLSTDISKPRLRRTDNNLKAFCNAFEKIYDFRPSISTCFFIWPDACSSSDPSGLQAASPSRVPMGFCCLVRCLTRTNNSMFNMLNSAICLQDPSRIKKMISNLDCSQLVTQFLGEGHTSRLSLKQKEARFMAVDAPLNKMIAELAGLEKETMKTYALWLARQKECMKTYALWLARQKIYYEADQKKREREDHDEAITQLKHINISVQKEMKRRRLEGRASRDASPWNPLAGLESFNRNNRPTDQFNPPRWSQNYATVDANALAQQVAGFNLNQEQMEYENAMNGLL